MRGKGTDRLTFMVNALAENIITLFCRDALNRVLVFVCVENAVRNFVQIYGELCEIGLIGREKYANCPKKCVEMNIAMSYVL